MQKKIKFILIAIIGLSCFTILLIYNFNFYKIPNKLEIVENITLTVDYNNDTIKIRENFTLDDGKTTAFDALDKWCAIKYDDYGWGIIVREIDGVRGSWIYMVNNYSPSISSSAYPLKDGDDVKWQKI